MAKIKKNNYTKILVLSILIIVGGVIIFGRFNILFGPSLSEKYQISEEETQKDYLYVNGGQEVNLKTKLIAITNKPINEETAQFFQSTDGGVTFAPVNYFADRYYNMETGELGYMIDVDPADYKTFPQQVTYKFDYTNIGENTQQTITSVATMVTPIADPLAVVPAGTTCSCKELKLNKNGANPVNPDPFGPHPPVGTISKSFQYGFGWAAKTEYIPLAPNVQAGSSCTEKQETQGTIYEDGEILDSVVIPEPLWRPGQFVQQKPRLGNVPQAGTAPFGEKTWRFDGYDKPQKDHKIHNPDGTIFTSDFPGLHYNNYMKNALRLFKAKMTITGGDGGGQSCQKCVVVVQEIIDGKVTINEATEAPCN